MTAAQTGGVIVRAATPADRDTIVQYNIDLALETEHKLLDRALLERGVAAALADPDRLKYLVAEHDGLIVGQTARTREWSDWRCGWIWWLQSVYVREGYRGRGVFRALFQALRAEAQAAPDVIGLRLYVERENTSAQESYQRLGFKPGGYYVFEDLWLEIVSRKPG
jgi:GNAT superfamily N-acetyltransferase